MLCCIAFAQTNEGDHLTQGPIILPFSRKISLCLSHLNLRTPHFKCIESVEMVFCLCHFNLFILFFFFFSCHFALYLFCFILFYSFVEINVWFEKKGERSHCSTDLPKCMFTKFNQFRVRKWWKRKWMPSINQLVKWHFYAFSTAPEHTHTQNQQNRCCMLRTKPERNNHSHLSFGLHQFSSN